MKALFLTLWVGLFLGCQSPGVILRVKVTDSDKPSKVKVLGEFTPKDYQEAQKSLELIKFLLPDLVFTNTPTIFWMDSKEFDGLTVGKKEKFILIDKYFRLPQNKAPSNNDYFKLGSITSHEMQHFERNLNEKDTQALTDNRLLHILFTEPDRIQAWKNNENRLKSH